MSSLDVDQVTFYDTDFDQIVYKKDSNGRLSISCNGEVESNDLRRVTIYPKEYKIVDDSGVMVLRQSEFTKIENPLKRLIAGSKAVVKTINTNTAKKKRIIGKMAKMLLPSSGRLNFKNVVLDREAYAQASTNDQMMSKNRDDVIKMLKIEDSLRKSSFWQERFDIELSSTSIDACMELQLEAAKLAEYDDPKFGVQVLRSVSSLFPDDDELLSVPMWIRHNRCEDGHTLQVGSVYPDLHLMRANSTCEQNGTPADELPLSQHIKKILAEQGLKADAPMIIVSGSIS